MIFARKVWHLLVAIKDGLVLALLLLFFAVLSAALASRPNPVAAREGALLLTIDGPIVEEPKLVDPLALLFSGGEDAREYRERDLVRAISGAADD